MRRVLAVYLCAVLLLWGVLSAVLAVRMTPLGDGQEIVVGPVDVLLWPHSVAVIISVPCPAPQPPTALAPRLFGC